MLKFTQKQLIEIAAAIALELRRECDVSGFNEQTLADAVVKGVLEGVSAHNKQFSARKN